MRVLRLAAIVSLALSFSNNSGAASFQAVQVAETRLDVSTPATTEAVTLQMSPDGDKIIMVGESEGKRQLWIHSLPSGTARPLAGTDDVSNPFPCWSPDSRSFAYFSSGGLKRIELETGSIRTLANLPQQLGRGCTWNREGIILFSVVGTRILRVSEDGGAVQPATAPDTLLYQTPYFLPDGRHFLFYAVGGGVYLGELGGASPRQLLAADSAAVYSRTGHVLFLRDATLYAQAFDSTQLELSGDPFVVAEHVPIAFNVPAVSASAAGHVVYRSVPGGTGQLFKWFDRTGDEISTVGERVHIAAAAPALSPDGLTLALDLLKSGNQDIWLLELASGKLTRFTSALAKDLFPVWSADGRTIYFASNQSGQFEMYRKPSSGDGSEELVLHKAGLRLPRDISPDGRFLLFLGSGQIMCLQLDGNPPGEFPIPGIRDYPQFSPDGLWIAGHANDSGRNEVYIQQFPSGRRFQVSNDGGGHARWRADGKELFFIALDGKLMAVPIELSPDGQQPKLGTPAPLFTPGLEPNILTSGFGQQYIVSNDGQRFLIATVTKVDSPIKVIRNWQPKP